MNLRTIENIKAAAARTRLLLFKGDAFDPGTPLTADETLDVRVTLDAPAVMAHEILRLRRLVVRNGGRP